MAHENTSAGTCPFCGSHALFDGVIASGDAYAYFQPSGLKLLGRLFAGVLLQPHHPARACRACGHVWAQTEPDKLARMWEQWCRPSGA